MVDFCMAPDTILKHLNIFKRHTLGLRSSFKFVVM